MLEDDIKFGGLDYNKFKKTKEAKVMLTPVEIESAVVCKFDKCKDYANALNLSLSKENAPLFNVIGYILSMRKSDDKRRLALSFNKYNNGKTDFNDNLFEDQNTDKELVKSLQNANLSNEQIDKLIECDTNKFCNLSFKALNNIIPHLEQGLTYDKACEKAGYNFNESSASKKLKIEWNDLTENGTNELQEITSPVTLRSVSQAIKVVNAIINKYGSPCAINIELAREMALNHDERNKLDKKLKERQIDNEKLITRLKEFGIMQPSGTDITKLRLYDEQGGKCAYSLKSFDKVFGVNNIFNNNNVQIDHIMPYSKCFDDSLNNKVLVLSDENQKKGNFVPFEYMSKTQWDNFEAWVNITYNNNPRKKSKLLMKSSTIIDENALNERALNDTKHMSRFIMNVLKNHLIFADSKYSKKPVKAINGSITSYLRKIWGINKIRFESDKHHAVDACVIACAGESAIQKITKYEQFKTYEKSKQKNCLINEDGFLVDKISGEKFNMQELSKYFNNWEKEFENKFSKINLVTAPWDKFVNELEIRICDNVNSELNKQELQFIGYNEEELKIIKPLFISRMPTRKMLGAIHKDTIKRVVNLDKNNSIIKTNKNKESTQTQNILNEKILLSKTKIQSLKLKSNIENNGEIKYEILNYPEHAKISDPLLYNALLNQLILFNGNGNVAFKEKFYKPIKLKDGTTINGNEVKTVKLQEKVTDYILVNEEMKKAANKSNMVRIDIFKKDGKSYIVPIYVSDVYKQLLPNKAIKPISPYDSWIEMTDEYQFAFSLYPNDLVYMEKFKGEFKGSFAISNSINSGKPVENVTKGFFYYNATNICTGACNFFNHDKSKIFEGVGMRNVDVIEKYEVDVLGEFTKVKNELRKKLKFTTESGKYNGSNKPNNKNHLSGV